MEGVYFSGLMIILFFPFIGMIAALFMVWFFARYSVKLKSGIYQEYEEHIDVMKTTSPQLEINKTLLQQLRKEVGFDAYIDIIQGDNQRIKEKVILKLSHNISEGNVNLQQPYAAN